MSDISRELQEYLSRNDTKDKEPLLPTTIKDIKIPKIGAWFSRNGNVDDGEDSLSSSTTSLSGSGSSSSWFSSGQSDPLCPSLVIVKSFYFLNLT